MVRLQGLNGLQAHAVDHIASNSKPRNQPRWVDHLTTQHAVGELCTTHPPAMRAHCASASARLASSSYSACWAEHRQGRPLVLLEHTPTHSPGSGPASEGAHVSAHQGTYTANQGLSSVSNNHLVQQIKHTGNMQVMLASILVPEAVTTGSLPSLTRDG
jgi:hypothetical protein